MMIKLRANKTDILQQLEIVECTYMTENITPVNEID